MNSNRHTHHIRCGTKREQSIKTENISARAGGSPPAHTSAAPRRRSPQTCPGQPGFCVRQQQARSNHHYATSLSAHPKFLCLQPLRTRHSLGRAVAAAAANYMSTQPSIGDCRDLELTNSKKNPTAARAASSHLDVRHRVVANHRGLTTMHARPSEHRSVRLAGQAVPDRVKAHSVARGLLFTKPTCGRHNTARPHALPRTP